MEQSLQLHTFPKRCVLLTDNQKRVFFAPASLLSHLAEQQQHSRQQQTQAPTVSPAAARSSHDIPRSTWNVGSRKGKSSSMTKTSNVTPRAPFHPAAAVALSTTAAAPATDTEPRMLGGSSCTGVMHDKHLQPSQRSQARQQQQQQQQHEQQQDLGQDMQELWTPLPTAAKASAADVDPGPELAPVELQHRQQLSKQQQQLLQAAAAAGRPSMHTPALRCATVHQAGKNRTGTGKGVGNALVAAGLSR